MNFWSNHKIGYNHHKFLHNLHLQASWLFHRRGAWILNHFLQFLNDVFHKIFDFFRQYFLILTSLQVPEHVRHMAMVMQHKLERFLWNHVFNLGFNKKFEAWIGIISLSWTLTTVNRNTGSQTIWEKRQNWRWKRKKWTCSGLNKLIISLTWVTCLNKCQIMCCW